MSGDILKKDGVNKKKAYIIGALLGVGAILITMLIFSFVLLLAGLDRSYATPFATVSLAVGCFIAARYTAKKIGEKGYATGMIIGGAVFILITLLSLIIGKNGLSLNTLFHFIIIMLAALVGGITGVNTDKHKKYI